MSSRAWMVSTSICLLLIGTLGTTIAEPPCAADLRKLCKDVPVGGGRIQACLKQHEAEVSEACRKTLDELGSEVKLLAVVCRWDIGRFCSDVSPGSGRVIACLKTNESQLSPECLKQLRSMQE